MLSLVGGLGLGLLLALRPGDRFGRVLYLLPDTRGGRLGGFPGFGGAFGCRKNLVGQAGQMRRAIGVGGYMDNTRFRRTDKP